MITRPRQGSEITMFSVVEMTGEKPGVKKQIFEDSEGRCYGPDVINFPEFCALERYIYDSRGQIDMGPALDAAIMRAFDEKKLFVWGPFGLRTDNWPSPIIDAMHKWILFHLLPKREDLNAQDVHAVRTVLKSAGYDLREWDNLI